MYELYEKKVNDGEVNEIKMNNSFEKKKTLII